MWSSLPRRTLLRGAGSLVAFGALGRAAFAQDARQEELAQLFNDPQAPVMGNSGGTLTIVKFFDVQCTYCRRAYPIVKDTLAADPDLRLLLRDWIVYGETSYLASRLLLAANEQGRYEAAMDALMTYDGRLKPSITEDLLKERGIDIDAANRWIASNGPEADKLFRRNERFAHMLGLRGTPGFVVGRAIIPGFVPAETFNRVIATEKKRQTTSRL